MSPTPCYFQRRYVIGEIGDLYATELQARHIRVRSEQEKCEAVPIEVRLSCNCCEGRRQIDGAFLAAVHDMAGGTPSLRDSFAVLTLFINESQVSFLEDMMWQHGVLETSQMAGAFQMLRSNDLFWSRVVRDYLIGERAPPSDVMSWNADATRMPYRMHSDYLRKLFLNDDLAEGRYLVDGAPIALSDLRAPMFVVGTLWDHVAPWRSTYKVNFLADAAVTFVLASGGHNAGIVAAPDDERHSYQTLEKPAEGPYRGPDEWLKDAPHHEGSWWPEWARFLATHSTAPTAPPPMSGPRDTALDDAPGQYVLQR